MEELSKAEVRVLKKMLLGKSMREIARELGLARGTVLFHSARIYAKLQVEGRADLLRLTEDES